MIILDSIITQANKQINHGWCKNQTGQETAYHDQYSKQVFSQVQTEECQPSMITYDKSVLTQRKETSFLDELSYSR